MEKNHLWEATSLDDKRETFEMMAKAVRSSSRQLSLLLPPHCNKVISFLFVTRNCRNSMLLLVGLSKWCENWALASSFVRSFVVPNSVVGCSFKYLRKWNRTCSYSSSSSCHHNRNLAQFLFFFPRPLGELPRLVLLGFAHSIKILWLLFVEPSKEWFTCKTSRRLPTSPPTTICCRSGFFSFSWPTSLSFSLMTHFTYNRPFCSSPVCRILCCCCFARQWPDFSRNHLWVNWPVKVFSNSSNHWLVIVESNKHSRIIEFC